jgi:hypothetical protein
MSTVALSNGTILAAAFGGNGGGNSSYCSALGGMGGRLRGMNNEGFVNSELVLVDNAVEDAIESDINGSSIALQEIIAPSMPQNQWIPVTITEEMTTFAEANTTNATWCEHSNHRPTGRRGHSMTVVNNHVYIFGGALLKCLCTVVNDKKQCSSKNVYSSELWHFDVFSSMFTLLEPSGEEKLPRGREQHSATALPNGDIVIIGGLSSSSSSSSLDEAITEDLEPLNEVWKLSDPHRVTSHVIRGGDSSITQLPMELNQSYLSSHTLTVDLGHDICVEDLQLSLSLDHGCPPGIEYISIQSRHYQTKVCVHILAPSLVIIILFVIHLVCHSALCKYRRKQGEGLPFVTVQSPILRCRRRSCAVILGVAKRRYLPSCK